MKPEIAFWIMIIGLCGTLAQAECRYFRTSFKLVSCEADKTSPEKLPGMDAATPDDPTWLDQAPSSTAKFVCSCDYVLQGSNPLCDFDRTDEESYTIETDNVPQTCRRGKDLCNDFCARDLSS